MANQIKLAEIGDEQSAPAFRVWKLPFDRVMDSLAGSWRLATQRVRHLPTTVIVGAQKAGTSQLYAHMVKHPRCFGASEQAEDYFSTQPTRRIAWYRSRFPWRRPVWRR